MGTVSLHTSERETCRSCVCVCSKQESRQYRHVDYCERDRARNGEEGENGTKKKKGSSIITSDCLS